MFFNSRVDLLLGVVLDVGDVVYHFENLVCFSLVYLVYLVVEVAYFIFYRDKKRSDFLF